MKSLRKIRSPAALATFGAFFVPEPLGALLVLTAALWWLYRKLVRTQARGALAPSLPPGRDAESLVPVAPRSLAA
jgi:hypothetical protein